MKYFKIKIEETEEFELDITFIDVNNYYYKSPLYGQSIIVDFKGRKISRNSAWSAAYINNDKFSISFCTNSFYLQGTGRNHILYFPSKPELDKIYKFKIKDKFRHLGNSKFFKEKIIKSLSAIALSYSIVI